MSHYRVTIAEVATGIVRRPDSPSMRYSRTAEGEASRVFEEKEEALRFKDDVLERFIDLEVIVAPDEANSGGVRFFRKEGRIIGDAFFP